jgi:hypothetical protein
MGIRVSVPDTTVTRRPGSCLFRRKLGEHSSAGDPQAFYLLVMPGLVPGIHVLIAAERKTWMAGTSPAMTNSTSPGMTS